MSTRFPYIGNIGSQPEFREFPRDNDEPSRVLRLSVYFDNPIPVKDGFEDRGGFWAPVEVWHADAERWSELYKKGMRVMVDGRFEKDDWQDAEGNDRVTFKIVARHIGVLPYRIDSIAMNEKAPSSAEGVE